MGKGKISRRSPACVSIKFILQSSKLIPCCTGIAHSKQSDRVDLKLVISYGSRKEVWMPPTTVLIVGPSNIPTRFVLFSWLLWDPITENFHPYRPRSSMKQMNQVKVVRSLMVNSYGKSAASPMFSNLLGSRRAIPFPYTSRWLGKPWQLFLPALVLVLSIRSFLQGSPPKRSVTVSWIVNVVSLSHLMKADVEARRSRTRLLLIMPWKSARWFSMS